MTLSKPISAGFRRRAAILTILLVSSVLGAGSGATWASSTRSAHPEASVFRVWLDAFEQMKKGINSKTGVHEITRFFSSDLPVRISRVAEASNLGPSGLDAYFQSGVGHGIDLEFTDSAWKRPEEVLKQKFRLAALHGRDGIEFLARQLKLPVSRELDALNTGSSEIFKHHLETLANEKLGSISARLDLLRFELNALEWTERALSRKQLPGVKSAELAPALARVRVEKAELLEKVRATEIAVRRHEARIAEEWRKTRTQLSQDRTRFNELIAANRRFEVADLLRRHLPMQAMEPVERIHWEQWLESIERPDPARAKIVFRGLRGSPSDLTRDGRLYQTSTAFSRADGGPDQGLRELAESRTRNSFASARDASPSRQGQIAHALKAHAHEPERSLFLSASDLGIARFFSQGADSLGVLRIDERRLLPNYMSGYHGEMEVLIPAVIFPDEVVVHYREESALREQVRARRSYEEMQSAFDLVKDSDPRLVEHAKAFETALLEAMRAEQKFYAQVRSDLRQALGRESRPSDFALRAFHDELLRGELPLFSVMQVERCVRILEKSALAELISEQERRAASRSSLESSELREFFGAGHGKWAGLLRKPLQTAAESRCIIRGASRELLETNP